MRINKKNKNDTHAHTTHTHRPCAGGGHNRVASWVVLDLQHILVDWTTIHTSHTPLRRLRKACLRHPSVSDTAGLSAPNPSSSQCEHSSGRFLPRQNLSAAAAPLYSRTAVCCCTFFCSSCTSIGMLLYERSYT